MKPQELRIGNYVRLLKDEGEKDYQIDSGFDLYKLDESDCADIEPIELTEEWHNEFGCEKNGFLSFEYKITNRKKIIFSGDYIYLRDIQDMSNKESVGDDICVLWNNDIKGRVIHVHEWQNLYFALTGTELSKKLKQ